MKAKYGAGVLRQWQSEIQLPDLKDFTASTRHMVIKRYAECGNYWIHRSVYRLIYCRKEGIDGIPRHLSQAIVISA